MKLVFLIFSFEKTCILDFILWSPIASLYVSIFICKFVALVGVFVIFALWKDYLLVIGNILHRVFRWVIFVGIVAIVNYIRFGDKLRYVSCIFILKLSYYYLTSFYFCSFSYSKMYSFYIGVSVGLCDGWVL